MPEYNHTDPPSGGQKDCPKNVTLTFTQMLLIRAFWYNSIVLPSDFSLALVESEVKIWRL